MMFQPDYLKNVVLGGRAIFVCVQSQSATVNLKYIKLSGPSVDFYVSKTDSFSAIQSLLFLLF